MIEYRTATGGAEAGEGDSLTGLVTPFNVETTIGNLDNGGFREQIAPGAFKKTLRERDIVLIDAHDTGKPLARTSITEGPGSLLLREEAPAGLRMVEAIPVKTTYGEDVLKNARAGVIKGMSFGFEVIKDSWTDDEGRASNAQFGTRRTIHEVRLHEITTTAFPAYTTTELSARDAVNAARGVEGARAAKASYADLDTCAECGATEQYGFFCVECGVSMDSPNAGMGNFCGSCGSDLSAERSHLCAPEKRDNSETDSAESENTEPAATTPDEEARNSAQDLAIEIAVYSL